MHKEYIFKLLFFTILLSLAILSCTQKQGQVAQPGNWDKQNIRDVNTNDTAYIHAIKIAQENIDFFVKLLNDKTNNNLQFYIKSKFTQAEHVEHMWLVAERIDGNSFWATLDNVPNNLTNISYKDKVKVSKQDVEDWIIYEGDSVLLGNFISHAVQK